MTLDEYPGCTFSIKVNYCQAYGPGLVREIFVTNYTILNLAGCPELLDAWAEIILNEESTEGQINEFVNALDLLIYTRLENFFFARFGTDIGCDAPWLGNFIVTFVKATCGSVCTYQIGTTPGPGPGLDPEVEVRGRGKIGILVRANCSSEGCCRRSTHICYDPALDEVVKTTTATVYPLATPAPEQCASGVVEHPDVPIGYVLISCTPCTFSC